jgi:hypothetical protein
MNVAALQRTHVLHRIRRPKSSRTSLHPPPWGHTDTDTAWVDKLDHVYRTSLRGTAPLRRFIESLKSVYHSKHGLFIYKVIQKDSTPHSSLLSTPAKVKPFVPFTASRVNGKRKTHVDRTVVRKVDRKVGNSTSYCVLFNGIRSLNGPNT